MDWLDAIRRIRSLRLDLARRDPRRGMPVGPPGGAPESAIAAAERRMGLRLPPSYRALLAMHDGWPQLYAGAGLLGVRPLARGAYLGVAQMILEENEGAARRAIAGAPRGGAPRSARGWSISGAGGTALRTRSRGRAAGLMPFGIDQDAETLFAWDRETIREDGEMEVVLWMSGIGMRLDSFPDLLDLLADMLAAELELPIAEPTPAPASVTPAPPSSGLRSVLPPPLSSRPAPRPVARIAAFG
ncbi:MAG TPA: SMI1/KNR4 family protein [Candidatus Nanopelagicales bacterium]|nr:SMI1/KNR4 family protein [Candidatus Nanopelagicales bacterium]